MSVFHGNCSPLSGIGYRLQWFCLFGVMALSCFWGDLCCWNSRLLDALFHVVLVYVFIVPVPILSPTININSCENYHVINTTQVPLLILLKQNM
mmetsp:Transcript_12152/g.26510  ORF Transcript_12152/g.26510 Transcript_12152/m.26510 type:complete len:94 (+) Transcript_12152:198-479(+)